MRRRKAAGWKAPGACCSEGEEEGPLPCGWRACCPLEEAEEGVCHPRPCSGWVAGEACWRRARRSLTGSDVWSLLQKQHLGFQGKGEESAQGWAAWEPQALGGTPGCADLTEWVLVYWVLAGERYQALSPRQALGEAFGSSEALGVHFCGLEKARGTSLGHLGARKVWQMWLFLLVAKLGVGLLQNLKKRKKNFSKKIRNLKGNQRTRYIPSYWKSFPRCYQLQVTIIYIKQILYGPSWRQRNRSQLSVYLLVLGPTTCQLSKGFGRGLLALRTDKKQDEAGRSSREIPTLYKRTRTDGVGTWDFC